MDEPESYKFWNLSLSLSLCLSLSLPKSCSGLPELRDKSPDIDAFIISVNLILFIFGSEFWFVLYLKDKKYNYFWNS